MDELRKDPTRGRWVLVRPGGEPARPDSACPFCPGNESLTPPEIAAYRKEGSPPKGPGWSVRVVPEANPYFRIERDLVREGVGLYDRISPRGATELIVESPSHDDTPASMPEAQWAQVLWMYRDRLRDLKRDLNIRDILITRRHRLPGAQITHPYSRLTAIPIIFDDVRQKLDECRLYFEYKRRCVYCDIVHQEVGTGTRMVRLTEHFLALAPYAPRSPFEVWVLPRRHACAYEQSLTGPVAADLASLLTGLFKSLAVSMGDPPFEMVLYTAPNEAAKVLPGEWTTLQEDYHWHIEVAPTPRPRLNVGGIFITETSPEETASRLREAWQ
ncbi:MAG TPA: galactose-1-phosphate uridylyltransferase [Methylomirabilota bacterium]|nr:galactose-1-phosphate uridylyltransferase [Methylomirabilota bacterium]